jgi:hypothetical protein
MSNTERDIRNTKWDIEETESKIEETEQNIKTTIKKYNCLPQVNNPINTPSFTRRGITQFESFIEELLEDLDCNRDDVYDPDNVDPDESKYLEYLHTKCFNLLCYLKKLDDLNEKLKDLNYTLYLDNFQY